ncbi:MAG: hypothetical protein PWQ97_495 [Tepidanaerobacteraceae bacterium]|nr:hypothetical protein [Tepidanaerobacteraceae bacterium]
MASSDFYTIVKNYLQAHVGDVLLALIFVFLLTLIVFVLSNVKLASAARRHYQLMRGVDGKNLEQMLENNLSEVMEIKRDLSLLKDKVKELERQGKLSIKKIKFKRYNAFFDMGGDLSFSLVLLNEYNTGVMITSIYARDENRIYLKPIVNGNASYTLSPEEREILDEALRG